MDIKGLRPIFSQKEIKEVIKRLAKEIEREYRDKSPILHLPQVYTLKEAL